MANIHEVKNKLVDKIGVALLRDNTSEDFVNLAQAVYILLNCEEYNYLKEFNNETEAEPTLPKNWLDVEKLFEGLGLHKNGKKN